MKVFSLISSLMFFLMTPAVQAENCGEILTVPIITQSDGNIFPNLQPSSVKVQEITLSDDQNQDTMHELEKTPDVRFHIHSKIENTGGNTTSDIELRYYISLDKTFGDGDDVYLASDKIASLGAGETHTDRKTQFENGSSLKTPEDLGEYYI